MDTDEQLALDLQNAIADMRAAFATPEDTPEEPPIQQELLPRSWNPVEQDITLRAAVRRLVGILATQSGRIHRDIWVFAYHELGRRTGYNPAVGAGPKEVLLDRVAAAGMMQELHQTVQQMLTDPTYAPGANVTNSPEETL